MYNINAYVHNSQYQTWALFMYIVENEVKLDHEFPTKPLDNLKYYAENFLADSHAALFCWITKIR